MNILVTGASGQLGLSIYDIVRVNQQDFKDCTFFFTSRNPKKEDIIQLDIVNDNVEQFINDNEIDIIINCAAYTNVNAAEIKENHKEVYDLNCYAPSVMAKAIKERNGYLIHISTDFVYNDEYNQPNTENKDTLPLSIYAKSKLYGEYEIKLRDCNYIIIRTSWLFSQYGKNFVKTIYNKIANIIESNTDDNVKVVSNQIGTPTSAVDLANVILYGIILSENYKKMSKEIFNYTSCGCCSWYDFAKAIEIIGFGTHKYVVPIIAKDTIRPRYSVMDTDKIREYIGGIIEDESWMTHLNKTINIINEKDIHTA